MKFTNRIFNQASLAVLLGLAATTTLWGQSASRTIGQFATLDLPDAPTAQSTSQPPAQSTSQPPAQSTAQPPAQSNSQPPADDKQDETEKKRLKYEEAERELQAEEHQRIAGIVPNFNTVLNGSAVPLSAGQKMRASFRSAVDPYQFALAGLTSAYGQATDSHSTIDPDGFHHGYQQGWIGYSKRYGASFADQFDGTILGNGVFPVILHQDARYYRLGTGKVMHRLIYSVGTTVRCKGDNGKWQPNISNLLGNLAAGGISNVYYPAADRGFELTVEQALTVTAEGAVGALLIEFYPDIEKHVFHRKGKGAAVAPAAQP